MNKPSTSLNKPTSVPLVRLAYPSSIPYNAERAREKRSQFCNGQIKLIEFILQNKTLFARLLESVDTKIKLSNQHNLIQNLHQVSLWWSDRNSELKNSPIIHSFPFATIYNNNDNNHAKGVVTILENYLKSTISITDLQRIDFCDKQLEELRQQFKEIQNSNDIKTFYYRVQDFLIAEKIVAIFNEECKPFLKLEDQSYREIFQKVVLTAITGHLISFAIMMAMFIGSHTMTPETIILSIIAVITIMIASYVIAYRQGSNAEARVQEIVFKALQNSIIENKNQQTL